MEETSVTGAGISLLLGGEHQVVMAATDDAIEAIETLQTTLGEGPCVDAHRIGEPVFAPDIVAMQGRRWPALVASAVERGVRAVYGFPVQVDGVGLGAMDLYRDRPGHLTAPGGRRRPGAGRTGR